MHSEMAIISACSVDRQTFFITLENTRYAAEGPSLSRGARRRQYPALESVSSSDPYDMIKGGLYGHFYVW